MPASTHRYPHPGSPFDRPRRTGPAGIGPFHPAREYALRVIRLLAWPRNVLFWNMCMTVYERVFTGCAADCTLAWAPPLPADFRLKTVFSNRDADELEAEGFVFRNVIPFARQRLDAGAIAFCVFHAFEFANCGWVALDRKAQSSLPEPHVRVNFDGNESFTGGTLTSLKYRGMGLMTYNLQERCRFLRDKGVARDLAVAVKGNPASRKAALKAGYRMRGRAGFKNRLRGRIWREWPLP